MEKKMARRMSRRTAMVLPLGLLSSCSIFGSEEKPPVPGIKIPVIGAHQVLLPSHNAPPVSLPSADKSADWPQSGRNSAHVAGNAVLPARFGSSWSTSVGVGSTYRQYLNAMPIVAGGRVFAMDAAGHVDAISLSDGQRLWRKSMRPRHDNSYALGGGLAFANGVLYVATGFSELRALDPASGATRWRKSLGQPARSAPTIGGGLIMLVLLDNTLIAREQKSGAFAWRFPAAESANSLLGAGAPAYHDGIVVAGFGSGQLAGINATTGSALWEQSLASGYGIGNPLNISSIVADPIISGGLVIATALSNSTAAFDMRSGRAIWSLNAGGEFTPSVAGEWLFLLTESQRLAAIHAPDGAVAWVTQLPQYRNEKKRSGPISWCGPLLAGSRLFVAGNDKRLLTVDARNGSLLEDPKSALVLAGPAQQAPITAAGELLVLTSHAVLTAYR